MVDLSIVIPVYNTEDEYLRPCLESLESCARAGMSFEAIIVDDGSDNSYGELLEGILKKYGFFSRYYRKDNGGQNSARSFGAKLAQGRYLLFMDSDDRLVPAELMKVLNAALNNKAKILCFNFDRVSPGGALLTRCAAWHGPYRTSESLSTHILESDSLVRQLYCRKSFIESGVSLLEGPRIGEDMASAVPLLLSIGEASSIGATPYLYVQRPTSALHDVPENRVFDIIRSAEGMLERISVENRERYATDLEALCVLHVLFWGGIRSIQVTGSSYRDDFFHWMLGYFPSWRSNPYLANYSKRFGLKFRLVTSGFWGTYSVMYRIKRIFKRLRFA